MTGGLKNVITGFASGGFRIFIVQVAKNW